jgi:hypothetical protein
MDHPLYLAMVIAVLTLFGCVLGFASFEETRARRRVEKKETKKAATAKTEKPIGSPVLLR